MIRIGNGYDLHRLSPGRELILGGVNIPHELGLLGHSDADALTHAVIDALLGAAKLGDIGRLFPDTDPAYRGICSMDLLARVGALLKSAGWTVLNIDATLLAQRPKLAPYIPQMERAIAVALGLNEDQVSVKAKTGEQVGVIGQEQAIAALASALIEQ